MAKYQPIDPKQKQDFIDWGNSVAKMLHGRPETPNVTDQDYDNSVFKTPEGDVAAAKTLVGLFLAEQTGMEVTID